MKALPILRMLAFTVLCVLFTAVTGFLVGIETENFWAILVAMFGAIGTSGFFLLRWWLRAARSAGHSTAVNLTLKQSVIMGCLAAWIAGSMALTYVTYSLKHDRVLEFCVAILLAVPAGFIILRIAHAAAAPPSAQEAAISRLNVFIQATLPIVFTATVIQHLNGRQFAGLTIVNDLILASAFVITPLMPISAYFSWLRYLRARDLANNSMHGA